MPEDLLPAGARLVHIGPQKTGTTSIQVAMAGARDEMRAAGVHYPKGPYRRRKAGWALGLPGGPPDAPMRHWDDLVAEVRDAGDLRVCVSDENYARAESPVAEKIVRELGDERVHVVAVARRLDRYLPSQWQERVKAGVPASYEEWLEAILGEDTTSWERWNVWQGHDIGGLVERWLEFVDADRFTLVIADESDRSQLQRVFEEMLGLPADTLKANPDRSNVSLSWSELEVLRALRDVYDDNGWARTDRIQALPRIVEALRARPESALGPRSAPMPGWAHDRVRALSNARADLVATLPIRVIGDPELLRVPDAPASEVDSDTAGLVLPVGLVAGAIEGAVRAERARAERILAEAAREPGRRPAAEVSGRDLLRLAGRRALGRMRRG